MSILDGAILPRSICADARFHDETFGAVKGARIGGE